MMTASPQNAPQDASGSTPEPHRPEPHRIAIISAIPNETQHLLSKMDVTDEAALAGFTFYTGTLDGVAVVLVQSGMGKVNAAVVTTVLLTHYSIRLVLFSGIAGGLDSSLNIGDVVIGTHLVQHDYGVIKDGHLSPYHPGHLPFLDPVEQCGYTPNPETLSRIKECLQDIVLPEIMVGSTGGRVPKIVFGKILTGDHFLDCAQVRDILNETHDAQAIEMEGAAIAQVAERFSVPLMVVRCLSDLAGAPADFDFEEFNNDAAAVAARVVRHILTRI